MKKYRGLVSVLTMFAIVALFCGTAAARKESIYQRIEIQRDKIRIASQKGALTHREADILRGNLAVVQAKFERYWARGRLSERNVLKLHRMLDENNAMIQRLKNNPIRRLK